MPRRLSLAPVDLILYDTINSQNGGGGNPPCKVRTSGRWYKLKLTVNEEKTRIGKMQEGQFDFLGCTFERMYSTKTGKAIWATGHRRRASNAWSRKSMR